MAQQQRAALHGEAGIAADRLAQHDGRARHHARAEEIAGIALDQDDAAALAVRRPPARIAPQQDEPAGHAAALAGQPAAEPVAGIAADLENPASHRRPGEGPGLAADREPSAAHGEPRIGAGIAFEDELAASSWRCRQDRAGHR